MQIDKIARLWDDPRTPPDERQDLTAEIFDGRKGFLAGQKLPHPDEILAAVDELDEWERQWLPMHKAVQLQAGLPFQPIGKTKRGGHEATLYLNDLGVVGGLGPNAQYVERPGTGFEFLRTIYHHIDLVKCITNTFVRQVTAFCVPESDPSPLGFHFVRKDRQPLTDDDLPRIRRLERMILDCGDEPDPRKRRQLKRDDMRGYVSKLVTESLILDACPVETQLTANKKLSGLYSVPGDTIRLCTEDGYEGDDEIMAVQVVQGMPVSAFTHWDLIYDVRNPRADLNAMGYGYSELEQMIKVLTGYYNAINFNHAGMDKNSLPRGFVTVFGAYNDRAARDFERRMKTMLRGASNRWEVPIMYVDPEENGGKAVPAAWTPMDKFDEMLFARWIVLQASLAGALYGMDPTEFHFDTFAVRGSSPLNSNDIADKIAHSKSKGLEPVLRFVQNHFNTWVVPLIDDFYEKEFIGLQPEDADKKHERQKLSMTVNEIRQVDGHDPLPGPMGDAPVNPSLIGVYLSTLQQQPGDTDDAPPADDTPLSFGGAGGDEKKPKEPPQETAPATKPTPTPMTKAESGTGGLIIIERDDEDAA